jgi:ATP-dependent DNA ligase
VTDRYLQLIVKTGYDSVSMKGNAKKQRESDLYKHALREAREHLARWERLGKQLDTTAVIDGEICSLDKRGRPQFNNLLFHRGYYPCFLAFDLLMRDHQDCRHERLLDRKQELRRLLNGSDARIQYLDYVDGRGVPLLEQACQHDLEGIVAKQKYAPYVTDREQSTWFKIRNPRYSQWAGREKLFERERSREPVPGWHSCALLCEETF